MKHRPHSPDASLPVASSRDDEHAAGGGGAQSSSDPSYEAFLTRFTRSQGDIQAYIYSLVHDMHAADDVFQTTSLELWRKYASFHEGMEFKAWALGVARNKVLHYWRSKRRDRHVFSEEVFAYLADMAVEVIEEADDRHEALLACLEGLPERQRQLISLFYGEKWPVGAIATHWNRSVHAVYKSLKMLRKALLACVEGRLAARRHSS